MDVKLLFHYISYLQYPLMALGGYFAVQPYFQGFEALFEKGDMPLDSINSMLVFMGLGVSFSTLQDTEKTQNTMSKRIWEDPKRGKSLIILFAFVTAFVIMVGLIAFFSAHDSKLKEVSFGFIVFGLGLIGMLKAMVEMSENHRKDKK